MFKIHLAQNYIIFEVVENIKGCFLQQPLEFDMNN